MPFPSEHSARVKDPGQFDKFARKNIAPGVDIILGIKGNKSETQAYRFAKEKFTPEQAKAWLKDHKIDYIRFEPARDSTKEQEQSLGEVHTYESIAPANVQRQEDGALLIKDVTIFTPGIFVDSLTREPTNYSEELLRRDYQNWQDTAVWSRHSGGIPRDITEKIGKVLNLRYNSGVIGDILLHCKTERSRDVASMVENREVDSVSPEQAGEEKWNSARGWWDQLSLKFLGLAVVNRGACPGAKLFEKSEGWQSQPEPDVKGDMNEMETAEMEKKIAVLEKELADTRKELSAVPEKLKMAAEKGAEQSEAKLKELSGLLDEQKERIKALETAGATQRSNSQGVDKELEEWTPSVVYDPAARTTRGL